MTDDKPQTWREAHQAGKVWVTLKINGGAVRFGRSAVGTIEAKGPKTAEQGLALYLLSLGKSPLEVHRQLLDDGYVHEDGSWTPTVATPPERRRRT